MAQAITNATAARRITRSECLGKAFTCVTFIGASGLGAQAHGYL